MSQSFRIKDPKIKDLFLDIVAEELGRIEDGVRKCCTFLDGEAFLNNCGLWRGLLRQQGGSAICTGIYIVP